jgi:integrase
MKSATTHRSMSARAQEYLDYRRNLGYRLDGPARHLLQFARWADDRGYRGPVTTALAMQWATLPATAKPYHARRLTAVRCFARYCALFDPATEIPSPRLLGPAYRRATPFIYSAAQQQTLLKAARQLAPVDGLRPHTYVALFGLLCSTGLRISEALNLRRDDLDWQGGILTVKQTKFHKSRLVPLHPSAIKALRQYAKRRDERHPLAQTDLFFLSEKGGPLTYVAVRQTFKKLRKLLPVSPGQRPPRLHDFRHSFACERLLTWYREGIDVNHAITTLATYLGHVQVSNTYWYLTATPELLAVAASCLSPKGKSRKGGQP